MHLPVHQSGYIATPDIFGAGGFADTLCSFLSQCLLLCPSVCKRNTLYHKKYFIWDMGIKPEKIIKQAAVFILCRQTATGRTKGIAFLSNCVILTGVNLSQNSFTQDLYGIALP